MPERREGFLYIKSEPLQQKIAMSKKTGWIYTQDKRPDGSLVSYSPQEINFLSAAGMAIDMATHTVKKIFGGTIVGCDNKSEPKNDSLNSGNLAGGKVGPGGNDKNERDRELDIF